MVSSSRQKRPTFDTAWQTMSLRKNVRISRWSDSKFSNLHPVQTSLALRKTSFLWQETTPKARFCVKCSRDKSSIKLSPEIRSIRRLLRSSWIITSQGSKRCSTYPWTRTRSMLWGVDIRLYSRLGKNQKEEVSSLLPCRGPDSHSRDMHLVVRPVLQAAQPNSNNSSSWCWGRGLPLTKSPIKKATTTFKWWAALKTSHNRKVCC